MANIDFSDHNAFVGYTNLVAMAKLVDDKLRGSDEFIPSYDILGVDITKQTIDSPDLRKVISDMNKYLTSIGGGVESRKVSGSNIYKEYRYELATYGRKNLNRDPFYYHRQVSRKIDGKEAISRLKDALAFMPKNWIESFLGETEIIVHNEIEKTNGASIISSESNPLLTGTEHLSELYSAITEKKTIVVGYNLSYLNEIQEVLHPHFLKEYNGRWFVCGRTERDGDIISDFAILALDRISYIDFPVAPIDYVGPGNFDFEAHFSDIIGVTHSDEWPNIEEIVLRVHNPKVFNLIKTKKLHHSQTENETKSEISINVRPNIELATKILSFGADVEVISPKSYRDYIAGKIAEMGSRYID